MTRCRLSVVIDIQSMSMTTRKMRISAGIAVSGAALAAALVPTVAYAASIDPEDPGPASGPCPPGWGGTEGDCDPPNDIDEVDDSDVGDPQEGDPGGDPPDYVNTGANSGLEPDCGAPSDDMIIDESFPDEEILPEEPIVQTPRQQTPRTQTQVPRTQAPQSTGTTLTRADIDLIRTMIYDTPQQAASTESTTASMAPTNLEGLGLGG